MTYLPKYVLCFIGMGNSCVIEDISEISEITKLVVIAFGNHQRFNDWVWGTLCISGCNGEGEPPAWEPALM